MGEDCGAWFGGVGCHEAGADEEDIAEVDLGALGFETCKQVAEGDGERGEGVVGGGGRGGLGKPPAVVVD